VSGMTLEMSLIGTGRQLQAPEEIGGGGYIVRDFATGPDRHAIKAIQRTSFLRDQEK